MARKTKDPVIEVASFDSKIFKLIRDLLVSHAEGDKRPTVQHRNEHLIAVFDQIVSAFQEFQTDGKFADRERTSYSTYPDDHRDRFGNPRK